MSERITAIDTGAEQAAKVTKSRPPWVISLSILSLCVLISVTVVAVQQREALRTKLLGGSTEEVRDEQKLLAEAEELQSIGLEAYKQWALARQAGDVPAELKRHKTACAKLQVAMEAYNALLEPYRDAEGFLLPEYEGYETELAQIGLHLHDLNRCARLE